MSESETPRSSRPSWLAVFVRAHKDQILGEWLASVRQMRVAQDLPRPALLDHLPALLDRIAEMAEHDDGSGRISGPGPVPATHALERLQEGYDLGEVVTEYAVLRECILRQWELHGVGHADPTELRILNRAIDHAISVSVERFTSARERTLAALDRIAAAALGTDRLETFLPALLLVLRETTPAVDWATLLLRDGARLVARASVGLEEDVAGRYAEDLGEGIAGRVAQDKCALTSRDAANDPRVKNPAIRAAGTRALLALPLVRDGEVIGVAEIGSRTATDFSDEDKLLFTIMGTRASAMIEQHRLRELAEDRARDAERASRARDEVLAVVSHDLRNPLSAILAAATLLDLAPDASDGVRRKSAVIQRAAARMNRLLTDLLDASRIDGGRLLLALDTHELPTLIDEALDAQRPLADEKSIRLIARAPGPLPRVRIDHDRVLRVFANLLGNAIKFTPTGGEIVVTAAPLGAFVRVAIEDTGPGIPADSVARVFERFWQARDAAHEGAGLGLTIVKGLVEAHGGQVGVESLVGRGATFWFTLPAVATPPT